MNVLGQGAGSSADRPRDSGVSLIEVLVAIGLFGVLGTILLGLAISTGSITDDTRQVADIAEETRQGMERMSRELRQASKIADVSLPSPSAPNDITRFTLLADFDGNGCIAANATDPERLTYVWDPVPKELTLTATVGNQQYSKLLLAAKVSNFEVELDSSSWEYDQNQNGTTTWQELDASSIGNHDPDVFSEAELNHIDVVHLAMTATDGSHQIRYATDVDLRNQSQNGTVLPACP